MQDNRKQNTGGQRPFHPNYTTNIYAQKDPNVMDVDAAMAAGLSLQTCLLTIYICISRIQKGRDVKRQV